MIAKPNKYRQKLSSQEELVNRSLTEKFDISDKEKIANLVKKSGLDVKNHAEILSAFIYNPT